MSDFRNLHHCNLLIFIRFNFMPYDLTFYHLKYMAIKVSQYQEISFLIQYFSNYFKHFGDSSYALIELWPISSLWGTLRSLL